MTYTLGEIRNNGPHEWKVLGYLCQPNGLVIFGTTVNPQSMGCICDEWVNGSEHSIEGVWQQIAMLPISAQDKLTLGLEGVWPQGSLSALSLLYEQWCQVKGYQSQLPEIQAHSAPFKLPKDLVPPAIAQAILEDTARFISPAIAQAICESNPLLQDAVTALTKLNKD